MAVAWRSCLALVMAWAVASCAYAQTRNPELEQVAALVQQLNDPKPARRIAAAELLGDVGERARNQLSTITPTQAVGVNQLLPALRDAGPRIAELARDPNLAVRRSGLRALARVRAAGSTAVPVWEQAFTGTDRVNRSFAFALLRDYFTRADEIINSRGTSLINGRLPVMNNFMDDWLAFMPAAPRLLETGDAEMATGVLTALRAAMQTLERSQEAFSASPAQDETNLLVTGSAGLALVRPTPVREKVVKLAGALQALAQQIARNLPRWNKPVQVAAGALLENMARIADPRLEAQGYTVARADEGLSQRTAPALPRGRLLRPDLRDQGTQAAFILLGGLADATPAIANALPAASNPAQRALLEALEAIGPPAKKAIPTIIGLLNDEAKFVRWCATRALGRIGPFEKPGEPITELTLAAVQGIARRLQDEDIDVRTTACQALEAFGDKAASAVGALGAAMDTLDSDVQLSAAQALETIAAQIHADASPAVPGLIIGVRSPNYRVRQTAASVLGLIGPSASAAIPALERALDDSELDVRIAVALAMSRITAQ